MSAFLLRYRSSPPALPAGYTGKISVNGNRLVNGLNGSGVTIQLRGGNLTGLENSPVQGLPVWTDSGTPNYPLMQSWKFNCVRIPLNAASWLGLTVAPTASTTTWGPTRNADPNGNYRATVQAAVTAAKAIGCYVILDLHWSCPSITLGGVTHYLANSGQSAFGDDTAVPFWTSIAATFGQDPAVLFELFNEPFMNSFSGTCTTGPNGTGTVITDKDAMLKTGGYSNLVANNSQGGANFSLTTSWQVAGYQSMVNAIRGQGAINVLIVNGNQYTQQLNNYTKYIPTDPNGQIVLGWHAYPNAQTYANELAGNIWPENGIVANDAATSSTFGDAQNALNAGYPILCTEIGSYGGTSCTSGSPEVSNVIAWAKARNVGYCGWQMNGTRPYNTASARYYMTAYGDASNLTIIPILGYGQVIYNDMISSPP